MAASNQNEEEDDGRWMWKIERIIAGPFPSIQNEEEKRMEADEEDFCPLVFSPFFSPPVCVCDHGCTEVFSFAPKFFWLHREWHSSHRWTS